MYLDTKKKFDISLKEKHAKSVLSLYWGRAFITDTYHELAHIQQAIKNFVYAVPRMGRQVNVQFADSQCKTGHCEKTRFEYKIVLDPHIYFVAKEKEYALSDIIDIYSGLVFHEISHAFYTKKFLALKDRTELGRLCWNYLEDNRIEYLFDVNFPYLSAYLVSTNNFFKDYSGIGCAELISAIIITLQDILRGDEVSFPNLETPSGQNVYKLISDFINKYDFSIEFSYIEKMSIDLEKFMLELLNDFNIKFPEAPAKPNKAELEEMQKQMQAAFDGLPQEIKDKIQELVQLVEKSIKQPLSDEELKKVTEILCIAQSYEDFTSIKIPEELKYIYPEGDGSESKFESEVVFSKPTNELNAAYRELVQQDANIISKLRNMFTARLMTKTFTDPQKLTGKLDKRSLYRGGYADNIFKQDFNIKSSGVAVGILLDESGSMGNVDHVNGKAYNCRRAGLILQQVFSGIQDVELEVYSFTGNRSNRITYLYGSQLPYKCSLMNYRPGESNYDHVALWQTHLLLNKFTRNQNKMIFIVSDGQPCGHQYGDMSAMRLVKREVEKIQSFGTQVIQLAIDDNVNSEKMYTNWVEFKDPSTLTSDFIRLVNLVIRKYL